VALLLRSAERLDLVAEIPEARILTRPLIRTSASSAYLPIPCWVLDSAFVFVSVSVTLRTVFTPEIRLARALGGRMGGVSRRANAMTPITTTSPPIAALFLIGVVLATQITFHASRFTLHASYRFIELSNCRHLFQPLPVGVGRAGLPLA